MQDELSALLKNKVFAFRTFRINDHLKFDQNGIPKTQDSTGSWTVYGQIFIDSVRLNTTRLQLGGVRIVSHMDPKSKAFVPSKTDMRMDVSVDLPDGVDTKGIELLLKSIFVGSEGLVAHVPDYWREYLGGKNAHHPCEVSSSTPQPPGGGVVTAGRLNFAPKPAYTDMARRFLLEGKVVLEAEITPNGDVGEINIRTPAGAGFDDDAVAAVRKWKYGPTLLNGDPVCVITSITVNYELNHR